MPTVPKKADALIAFGANEGDCKAAFEKTVQFFEEDAGILELKCSSPAITRAATGSSDSSTQNEYLNAVIRVLTTHKVDELHERLIEIEKMLGRIREERWGPRTIDLDLLLFNDIKLQSKVLTVPHPRMSFRRFVLHPAIEVAANMVHPESGMTLQQLVDHLDAADQYFAVVTDDSDFVKTVIEQVDFDLRVIDNVEQFMKEAARAQLVVSVADEREMEDEMQSLMRFASNYAGPTLRIDRTLGKNGIEKEIRAAIEAINSFGE